MANKKTSKKISNKIKKLREEGVPQKQAVGQAFGMLGLSKKKPKKKK
jgi:hypothetical protein